ncbi:MAG TPA: protein kinase, partial [Pirellulales bacterium]|nr:protein kinase [Pirellulales bacterium]
TARPGFTQAAELVAQVADALDYAHGRRIIHRDVKPANILIDEAGLAHVADFGLARRDEGDVTVTVEGQMLGTPAYMSPEQAAGNHAQVDGRSDVYSLGVVLYELLTGERPFRGQVRMLLQQVIDEDPRPPRSLNDRVPRDLEKVCLMSLAKSKGRRYATAGEFAADLRRWLRGEPVLARPAGRLERASRWCRRNPAVAGLACAVVAALVAGAAVSWRFALIAGQRAEEAETSAQWAKEQETKAVENALVARRQSYVAGLAATRYHLERGEVEPAVRVLAESNPTSAGEQDLRGFEWRYLWRQAHAALASRDLYAERGQSVSGFEFSPDGRSLYITFSSNDPSDVAKFVVGYANWDLETDELLDPSASIAETLRGPLAISSDGRYLAGRLADGFLSLFDAQSGRQLAHLDEQAHGQMTQGQVFSLAFSPDGHALAGLHGYWQNLTALVWDVPQGTRRGEAAAGLQLRFSADGGLLATWGDSKPLELLSAESVESRGKLSIWPSAAALSPDGKLLAAATGDRETHGEIKLWNVETLTEAVTLRNSHLAGVTAMVFSPDGQRIATASHDATIKFFRTETGDELATINIGGAAVDRLVFSPNGELLAGGAGSLVQVWDGTLGSQRSPLDGERFQGVCAAFADDRRTLAVGGVERRFGKETGQVRLWDLASQSLRATIGPFARRVWAVAFSRDGSMLAVGGGDWLPPGRETTGFVRIFDPMTGGQRFSIPDELPLVTSLDFSSDGRMLAVSGGGVTLWNVPAGTRRAALPGQSNWIYAIDLADDDTRLAAGCQNGELVIWDVTTNESRVSSERHANCAFDVAFSPDGRNVATAGWDRVAWLWDAATLKQISGYTGHSGELFSIGFSPDAEWQRDVAGYYEGEFARILTPEQQRRLKQIEEHARPLSNLLIELDGTGVLTLGDARRAALDELTRDSSSFTPSPDPYNEQSYSEGETTRVRVDDERCWQLLSADERRTLDERLGPPFGEKPQYSIVHYSKPADLLRHRAVIDELRLTRQQVKDLRGLAFKTDVSIADPGPWESASLLAARRRYEAELSMVLSPEQGERLAQLVRQRRAFGPAALLDAEVVAALGIRPEQKKAIQLVVEQTSQSINALVDGDGNPPDAALQVSLLAEGRQRALNELDESQRERWRALIGPPFDWSWLGE